MRDAVDPWAWHGITRVSPSLVGSLQDDLAYGLMQAIPALKVRGKAGPSAIRGRALDRAVTFAAFHHDAPDDAVLSFAERVFSDEERKELEAGAAFDPGELAEERADLAAFLTAAVPHIRGWGVPEAEQGKVELEIEGLGVPMIGYFDLLYPAAVRDLKTTSRMPSAASQRHAKQLSGYAIATGRDAWVDYLTKRELRSYRIEDPSRWMAEVSAVLFALRRLLSISRDPYEICSLVAPNFEAWCWSDADVRSAARAIWGV